MNAKRKKPLGGSSRSIPLNFKLEQYNYELFEWYNPVFMILLYDKLMRLYPDQENHFLFKKATEAIHGAVAILGSRRLHENNVSVMQMNRQFQRPDVIAATHTLINGIPTLKITPLEITCIEKHTDHDDLGKFLVDVKLSKNYPREYIFICVVNKKLSYNIHDIAEKIKPLNNPNPIYIIGKTLNPISTSYLISSPQPIIAKAEFDLVEQGRNYPYPQRITFSEDKTNNNIVYIPQPAMPIDIYDFFMLDKEWIERIFGKRLPEQTIII